MTQWDVDMHARIAGAIKAARGKRSAQWLADRTSDLGYPITRAQIANYESGRKKNLDIAELVVIAAALNTSPVNLVFPGPYDAQVEAVPREIVTEFQAAQWFSGFDSYVWYDEIGQVGDREDEWNEWRSNTSTLDQWRELNDLIAMRNDMDNPGHIAALNRQIKSICERLGTSIATDTTVSSFAAEIPTDGKNA